MILAHVFRQYPTEVANVSDFTHAVKVKHILLSKLVYMCLLFMAQDIHTTAKIAVDTPDLYSAVTEFESLSFEVVS